MKILYDHQAFTIQNFGGISRYHYELLKEMQLLTHNNAHACYTYSNNEYLLNDQNFTVKTFFKSLRFRGKVRVMDLLNRPEVKRQLNSNKFDIFHPTYYGSYFLPFLKNTRYVVTCHDLIHEKFTNYSLLANDKLVRHKRDVLTRATKIIAVSANTKKDLNEVYKIPTDKIEVVHLANSLVYQGLTSSKSVPMPQPYLLYVGTRAIYKNFNFFVESIADLLVKEDILLVCAGGGQFSTHELDHFTKLKIRNKVKYSAVDDQTLANLYSNAIAFCFPSLYEGFGIPLVEAFAMKCPVLSSNKGSLSEIAGDAALYFDPYNKESILETVKSIIYNSSKRLELLDKGIARSMDFSWKQTALKTHNIYKQIL
jgi:glycosyltransferase involved in cell wall biosynthesis